MERTYSVRLTADQIRTINSTLSAAYYHQQRAYQENADNPRMNAYWLQEFNRTGSAISAIFDQYYAKQRANPAP